MWCPVGVFIWCRALQPLFKVSKDIGAFAHNHEGIGVLLQEHLAQGGDLVFGDDGDDDIGVGFGIAAHGLPIGYATAQLLKDHLIQLGILGEDLHIHIDVLQVEVVGDQSADRRVDDGVQGSGQLEEQGTDEVDDAVDDQGHAADAERLVLFGHVQADDVVAAAAATGPEGEANSGTGQQAADDAGGEPVRKDGHCRNGQK